MENLHVFQRLSIRPPIKLCIYVGTCLILVSSFSKARFSIVPTPKQVNKWIMIRELLSKWIGWLEYKSSPYAKLMMCLNDVPLPLRNWTHVQLTLPDGELFVPVITSRQSGNVRQTHPLSPRISDRIVCPKCKRRSASVF